MAIQSTSALNAYLTAASVPPANAGNAESATSAGEGTETQAGAGLGQNQLVSTAAVAGPAQSETGEAPEDSSTAEPSLPALYGRNARSVFGGMRAGSISLIA